MKSVEITNKLIQVSSMPRPFMPVLTHVFAQDRRLIMVVVLPVAVSRSFKSLQHHGKPCRYNSTQFPLVRREVDVSAKLDGVDEHTCCDRILLKIPDDLDRPLDQSLGSPSMSCFLVMQRNQMYEGELLSIMFNCPASLQVAWFQLQDLIYDMI